MSKTILIVGPTGAGKSSHVENYSTERLKAPEIGHSMVSQTTETQGYKAKVGEEEVILFDTPGLGDSQQRDQVFLDELVRVLQERCTGIHKFYFAMQVTEPRFNTYLYVCLSLLLQLATDIKQKPSVLTLMLTKADAQHKDYWGKDIEKKIEELKNIVREKFQININIITVGKENQDEFINDVKSASKDVFSQTQFMKNVQTLDTQRRKAYEELEAAKQSNEQNQQKLADLQAAVDKANTDSNSIQEKMRQEIESLKNQIQNMPSGGDGDLSLVFQAMATAFIQVFSKFAV